MLLTTKLNKTKTINNLITWHDRGLKTFKTRRTSKNYSNMYCKMLVNLCTQNLA